MHGASHEVLGRLAVGGMAELYLARTTHGDGRREIVVLKRILPHLAEDPEFVRMFRDEAHLAATLDHPNIVHVHDIGQDGEDYFFTMEYVHGENVRTLIKEAQKQETALEVRHVIQIAKGTCEGLHYAHEQTDENGEPLRIVHRDVSPTNILVSTDGEVKIVDFGIAKAAAATHVTQAGMLKGKASYMSPEQCRAEPVDRRSDVFAIGILIYEMTTLTRLFRGDNELAVLHQILTGTVEAPSTRVDHYDEELERIVMRALAQKREDRYPTAEALKEDLERYEALRGLSSSSESLGAYLRQLCGDKPFPWDEDEDEPSLDAVDQSATGTGMPTSMDSFEDEEDTQVNRKAPDLRTVVPGAPSEWTNKPPPRPDPPPGPPRGPAGRAGPAPRPGGPRPEAPRRPGPGPAGSAQHGVRAAARGLNPNRPRLSGAPRGVGIPPSSIATAAPPGRNDPRAESTAPMSKPGVARAPTPRPGRRMPVKASGPPPITAGSPEQPLLARSGRTLTGEGAGPLPPRSGRTVPGTSTSKAAPGRPGSAPRPLPGASQPGGETDRTIAAGAGSQAAPSAGGPRRPGRRPQPAAPVAPSRPAPSSAAPAPSSSAAAPSSPAGSSPSSLSNADRTQALTPEQALEMARLGAAASPPSRPAHAQGPDAWSGPGVDHTELAQPQPDIDEGARTVALPRYDRTMLATPGQEFPKGPIGWGNDEPPDPLTQTQKSTPSNAAVPDPLTSTQKSSPSPAAIAALTSTQKSPASALGSNHRPNSAAYPEVGGGGDSASASEFRRPEMRSPSPRPAGTPRSLWVPLLIVVIVGLAGTAVWLWLSSASASTTKTSRASETSAAEPTATTPPSAPSVKDASADEPGAEAPTQPADAEPTDAEPTDAKPTDAKPGDAADDGTAPAEPTDASDPSPEPTDAPEPSDEAKTDAPAPAGTRPRRPRRPRPSASRDPSPGPDLPEIKPGRPVPP